MIATPLENARMRNRRFRVKRRGLIQALKCQPCLDCKQRYDPEVMEFDHVRGEKLINLSLMSNRSIDAILTEAEKCDVVCANCHRLRTVKRRDEVLEP